MKTNDEILEQFSSCTIEEDADLDVKENFYYKYEDVIKAMNEARQQANDVERSSDKCHIQNVNRSVLRKFLVGENVRCTFNNSGNKFWSNLLRKHTKIEGIRDDGKTGISELQLGGKWFYENDFVRV